MKALVFDLDGTLYNANNVSVSDLLFDRSVDFLISKTNFSREKAKSCWQEMVEKYQYGIGDFENIFGFSKDEYCNYVCDIDDLSYVSKVENLGDVLLSLPQRKYVFTDNVLKQTLKILQHLGVKRDCFSGVFHAKSGDYLFKPKEEVFRKFLDEFKLNPQDCVMFEDSVKNLQTAKNLGMITVLIGQEVQKEDYCDYHFDDIHQALVGLSHIF